MTTKPEDTDGPDPIIALIAASDAARAAFMASDPEGPGNMPRAIELSNAMHEVNKLLYTAVPQTRAGTLAYAEWALRYHGCGKSLLAALRRELA